MLPSPVSPDVTNYQRVCLCALPAMARSATVKYELFITEPMGFKDVTELPGIRGVLGDRLAQAGYDKVSARSGGRRSCCGCDYFNVDDNTYGSGNDYV